MMSVDGASDLMVGVGRLLARDSAAVS